MVKFIYNLHMAEIMANTPSDGRDALLTEIVKDATAEEMKRFLKPIHNSTDWARVSAESNLVMASKDECQKIGVNYCNPKDIDTLRTVYYAALKLGYGPRRTKIHVVGDPETSNPFQPKNL